MDYYSILGVSKNATEAELKKAYKKQSMKHHPDRPGGDEAEFKKVNEAYSTLSDPQKRQMYDQFGTADPQQAGFNPHGQEFHFNSGNFEDIFGAFFGGGGNPFNQRYQRGPRGNQDITIAADITLGEVYTGKGLIATFRVPSGREQTVNIDIPKGMRHGETIRYQGLGDDSIPNMPRGNLNVKVRILRHPKYQVDGIDLHTFSKINVFDLMLGTTTLLELPTGKKISINVPEGTQPGTTLSIHGQGLPDYNSGRSGNIYLQIKGEIPKNLTEEQKEIIRKLK